MLLRFVACTACLSDCADVGGEQGMHQPASSDVPSDQPCACGGGERGAEAPRGAAQDPKATKPEDWDEQATIVDPEDKKVQLPAPLAVGFCFAMPDVQWHDDKVLPALLSASEALEVATSRAARASRKSASCAEAPGFDLLQPRAWLLCTQLADLPGALSCLPVLHRASLLADLGRSAGRSPRATTTSRRPSPRRDAAGGVGRGGGRRVGGAAAAQPRVQGPLDAQADPQPGLQGPVGGARPPPSP